MVEGVRGLRDLIIMVKGGGEMATGVAHRLARSGFRVCLTEIPEPLAVRRAVSFCEAVLWDSRRWKACWPTGQKSEEVFRAWKEG